MRIFADDVISIVDSTELVLFKVKPKIVETKIMSKISILEKFATDAINAPALVTGGGKCKKGSKKSRKGSKKGSKGSKGPKGSKGSKGGCLPAPVVCPKA